MNSEEIFIKLLNKEHLSLDEVFYLIKNYYGDRPCNPTIGEPVNAENRRHRRETIPESVQINNDVQLNNSAWNIYTASNSPIWHYSSHYTVTDLQRMIENI